MNATRKSSFLSYVQDTLHTVLKRGHLSLFIMTLVIFGQYFPMFSPQAQSQERTQLLRIQDLEGQAQIERIYEETFDAQVNDVLIEGDRFRTHPYGRAELSMGNGVFIRVNENTTLEIIRIQPDDPDASLYIRLILGSLYIDTQGIRKSGFYGTVRIDTPDTALWIRGENLTRVDVFDEGTSIMTFFGTTDILHPQGELTLYAGQIVENITPQSLPSPLPLAQAYVDEFDDYNEFRRDFWRNYRSPQYLPEDIGFDAYELEEYGRWDYHPTYGNIWIPPVTGPWMPYYNGYWTWVGDWLWVPYEPWGWVTHHYGYWGFDTSFGWYWIPSTRFGFAWVAWFSSGSYFGWCPLTYGGVPLALHYETNIYLDRFFPDPYFDTYGHPWVVVDPSYRWGVPVINMKQKIRIGPHQLQNIRISKSPVVQPWDLGLLPKQVLQKRSITIRDKLIRVNTPPTALKRRIPALRDLQQLNKKRQTTLTLLKQNPVRVRYKKRSPSPVPSSQKISKHRDRPATSTPRGLKQNPRYTQEKYARPYLPSYKHPKKRQNPPSQKQALPWAGYTEKPAPAQKPSRRTYRTSPSYRSTHTPQTRKNTTTTYESYQDKVRSFYKSLREKRSTHKTTTSRKSSGSSTYTSPSRSSRHTYEPGVRSRSRPSSRSTYTSRSYSRPRHSSSSSSKSRSSRKYVKPKEKH